MTNKNQGKNQGETPSINAQILIIYLVVTKIV